jgi:hypothetical protein
VVILVIAFWLGYFIDNYESKNPCPEHCKIEHKHYGKQDINESSKETN